MSTYRDLLHALSKRLDRARNDGEAFTIPDLAYWKIECDKAIERIDAALAQPEPEVWPELEEASPAVLRAMVCFYRKLADAHPPAQGAKDAE